MHSSILLCMVLTTVTMWSALQKDQVYKKRCHSGIFLFLLTKTCWRRIQERLNKIEEDKLRKKNPLPCGTPGLLGWCWRVPAALVKKGSHLASHHRLETVQLQYETTPVLSAKEGDHGPATATLPSLSPTPHQKSDFQKVLQDHLCLMISLRDAAPVWLLKYSE